MMIWCCWFGTDLFLSAFVIPCQTWPFWVQKNYRQFFLFLYFFLHYFHCIPLHEPMVVVNLFSMHVSLISQPFLDETCASLYLCILHKSNKFWALYHSYKVTLQGTLHSRIKKFATDNSIVIVSSNSKRRLIW